MTRYHYLLLSQFFAILVAFLAAPNALPAQDYASLVRTAERLYAEGKYGDAGEYFERAWRFRTQKQELIYRAGECYYWVKDYRKAADCYRFVKGENERFELVGLKYARALKQDGRYREAMEEFKWFARDYKGPGKDQLDKIIVNDIKGCEMGIELATQKKPRDLPVEVQTLPEWVNSPENEFAPVPFSDDVLYFSSMVGGRAKLFRTTRQNGQWGTPIEPQGLPEMAAEHFGNGSFSPDGSRFYFTQCTAANPDLVGGNGLRAHCEIYVIRRGASGWGQPERLREYINMVNCTNTQPFVAHENGTELLFFASDREGTFGGLDLYVCHRPLDTDELDFSFPQNLGEPINTGGDEITPFYVAATRTLFFRSNGLVSLGGMDVFKALRADEGRWAAPENMGVPFNSTCDDFFFAPKKSGNGGFFVSNRLYGHAKTSTRHEDIFEFFPRETQLFVIGKIFDSSTGRILRGCAVSLLDNAPGETPRLLQSLPSEDGTFKFPILPERDYAVEVSKEGYQTAFVPLKEQTPTANGYEFAVSVKPELRAPPRAQPQPEKTPERQPSPKTEPPPEVPPAKPSPKTEPQPDAPPLVPAEPERKTVSAVNPAPKPAEPPATTGQASDLIFKIQLEALPSFQETDPKYASLREKGQLTAEPIADRSLVRIMLGDFPDKKLANDVARELRNSNAFPQAFVVRYVAGVRQ